MLKFHSWSVALSIFSLCLFPSAHAAPQALGNAGNISVVISDATGAVVQGTTAEIQSPRSGYHSSGITDTNGVMQFHNLPYNTYHLSVASNGFQNSQQDVDVRSSVPVTLTIKLEVGAARE